MNLAYPSELDNTPIIVTVTDGIDENGEEKEVATYDGLCNFSERAKHIRDVDGHLVQLNGKAVIGCDIAPQLKFITGKATINGKDYKIHASSRPRGPNGAVHHTTLELK